jgi:hypothetical protein
VTFPAEGKEIPLTFAEGQEIFVVLDVELRIESREAGHIDAVGKGELDQGMMQFDPFGCAAPPASQFAEPLQAGAGRVEEMVVRVGFTGFVFRKVEGDR